MLMMVDCSPDSRSGGSCCCGDLPVHPIVGSPQRCFCSLAGAQPSPAQPAPAIILTCRPPSCIPLTTRHHAHGTLTPSRCMMSQTMSMSTLAATPSLPMLARTLRPASSGSSTHQPFTTWWKSTALVGWRTNEERSVRHSVATGPVLISYCC